MAWLSGTVIFLNIVVTTLAPHPLSDLEDVKNSFGLEGHAWVAYVAHAGGRLLPLCMLASAASLVVRYGHSPKEVREQIKWLAFATSVVAFGVSTAMISGAFFVPDDTGGTDPL